MKEIEQLFQKINEVDKEIEEKINLKKKLFEEIKKEFCRKVVPEIVKQLKVEVRTEVFQDTDDPTWIDLMLIVQDNCTEIKSPEDKYAKEDELLNKVYALLDRLLSKEIVNRISVIPVVKEVIS